jgi:hypothetical protein
MEEAPSEAYSGQGETCLHRLLHQAAVLSVQLLQADIYPAKVQPSAQPKPVPAFTVFQHRYWQWQVKKVWIPDSVKDIFFNEAQIPEGNEIATVENISHVAMLLFVGTSMPLRPCPNLAEVVAVLHLNLVGARRMTRTSACLPAVASRWLIPCANQSQLNVVSIVKSIPYVKYQKK